MAKLREYPDIDLVTERVEDKLNTVCCAHLDNQPVNFTQLKDQVNKLFQRVQKNMNFVKKNV